MTTTPLVDFNVGYFNYPNYIGDALSAIVGLGFKASAHEQSINEANRITDTKFNQMIQKDFALPSDDKLLQSLLSTHGMFARRFFSQSIRQRISKRFAEINIDLKVLSDLLWKAWERDTSFVIDDPSWAIGVIIDDLYDQTFIRLIRNQQIFSEMEIWFEKFAQPRGCSICKRLFRVIDLPDWMYFGSNACIDCCFTCPMELPEKEALRILVPAFVKGCGFIPSSNISPINYAFCSRLSSINKIDVFRAYASIGGIEHVKREFGSWFRALAETGALPGGVLPTARGVRCLAQDGHECLSLDQIVD